MANLSRPQPCYKKWSQLTGGEAVRFCDTCQKNVHNLSALPRAEAEALMDPAGRTERLCVAYMPDAEGNPLTLEQCQVAADQIRDHIPKQGPASRWLSALLAAIATGYAAMLSGCAGVPPLSQQEAPPSRSHRHPPVEVKLESKDLKIIGDEGIYTELSREPIKKQQTKLR